MIELDEGRGAMICRWLLSSRSKSLWISFRSRNLIPKALRLERASSRDINVFSNEELNFKTSQFSIMKYTQCVKSYYIDIRMKVTYQKYTKYVEQYKYNIGYLLKAQSR